MSWIDEHHAHLMLDPLYEPSQTHESDLIKQTMKTHQYHILFSKYKLKTTLKCWSNVSNPFYFVFSFLFLDFDFELVFAVSITILQPESGFNMIYYNKGFFWIYFY